MKNSEKLKNEINVLLEKEGYQLVEIKFSKYEGDDLLSIIVKRSDNTYISMNQISNLSTKISDKLDEIDDEDKPYMLNVESAGIDDSLDLSHIEEYVDKYVSLELNNPLKNQNKFLGKIKEVKENEIIFEYFIKGARKKLVIEKNNIKKGNLEYK
ncbi:MAG: hypothetical protein IAA85_04890 [Firmicutes bacterium]|nr:hypothetical protein [Candidatus Alectryobacillus merdavium]